MSMVDILFKAFESALGWIGRRAAARQFIRKYSRQIRTRESTISPQSVYGEEERLPIDTLYVKQRFRVGGQQQHRTGSEHAPSVSDALPQEQVIEQINRTVILGDPGGGKSTFAQYLCYKLSLDDISINGRRLIPFLVPLREYRTAGEDRIKEFLVARATYQVKPPEHVIENLLRTGRALVVFDGLDEVLDTSARRQVRGNIESFCELYPQTPVLVTSRRIGYDQAFLDESVFTVFELLEFDRQQVRTYVNKFFTADRTLSEDEATDRAHSFLNESRHIADLRANPLLLGLLCRIYRHKNYIPENRVAIYEQCARLLFEEWDKTRGVGTKFEDNFRNTIEHLAYCSYIDHQLQSGIGRERLIELATDFLCRMQYQERRDDARREASRIADRVTGRLWVFTDMGRDGSGGELYQFTHRTFLEYFAACYLVKTKSCPELTSFLIPRIVKKEWDRVWQLALELAARRLHGNADTIVNTLLDASAMYGSKMYDVAMECLGFMVPTDGVSRRVAAEWTLPSWGGGLWIGSRLLPGVLARNRKVVREQVCKRLIEAISGCDEIRRTDTVSMVVDWDEEIFDWVYKSCRDQFLAVAQQHVPVAVGLWRLGRVSLNWASEHHTLDAIVKELRGNWGRDDLEELGQIIGQYPPPHVELSTSDIPLIFCLDNEMTLRYWVQCQTPCLVSGGC